MCLGCGADIGPRPLAGEWIREQHPATGSGLQGLGHRLAAFDGRLQVESPADAGTLVAAAIPIPAGATNR